MVFTGCCMKQMLIIAAQYLFNSDDRFNIAIGAYLKLALKNYL